jgi:regulatory protein
MADAYLTGLKWLAQRELSEAQVRTRLARRAFAPDAIDEAIARLRHEHSIDDRRTAVACARAEANKRRGRLRVLQRLAALGIPRAVAGAAVTEVFGGLNEDDLIQQALERRLQRVSTPNATVLQRAHRYLLGQGFDAARVHAAIRQRMKNTGHDD